MNTITLNQGSWLKKELSHDAWVEHYDAKNMVIAGLPDYFALARSADNKTLKTLQKHMENYWLIAGPVIDYNTKSYREESKIIHHCNSRVIRPKEREAPIPEYEFTLLEEVLNSDLGLNFFQKLFLTKAGKKTIIEAMEKLSDKRINNISVYTPDLGHRQYISSRVASLHYIDDVFQIDCTCYPDTNGLSHGMQSNKTVFDKAKCVISIKNLSAAERDLKRIYEINKSGAKCIPTEGIEALLKDLR